MNEDNKKQWTATTLDLKKAIDDWTALSLMEPKLSPDEKIMQEFKKLLADVSEQIKNFTDPEAK